MSTVSEPSWCVLSAVRAALPLSWQDQSRQISVSQDAMVSNLAAASASFLFVGSGSTAGIAARGRTSRGRQPNSALKARLK
jgi:hypothetical protein